MGLISRVSSRTYRKLKIKKMQIFVRGTETHTLEVNSQQELLDFVCKVEEANASELMLSVNGAPIDFSALEANQTVDISGKLLGGRAMRRLKYNRRFVTEVPMRGGRRMGPNQRPK